jgi:hypothetical protein
MAKLWGLDFKRAAHPEVITEFMKAAGLGIDCSGFVYQTLKYAFDKAEYRVSFDYILDWPDSVSQRDEYSAGIGNFTRNASVVINPSEIRPVDIITIKNETGEKYSHMALILKENNNLKIAQSVIGQIPTGVHVSVMKIENGLPKFGFRPNLTESWEQLNETGRLEFRRLRIFE